MRALVVALIGIVAFGGGVMLGYKLDSDDKTTSTVETGLPAAVEETQAALLEAAESGDYEALRPFISDRFATSGGVPVSRRTAPGRSSSRATEEEARQASPYDFARRNSAPSTSTDVASVSWAIQSECSMRSASFSGRVSAMRSVSSRPASLRIVFTRWMRS